MAHPKALSNSINPTTIEDQVVPYITAVKKTVDAKDIEALQAVHDAQEAVLSRHASRMRSAAESNLTSGVTKGKTPSHIRPQQTSEVLYQINQRLKSEFYKTIREAAEIALYETAAKGQIPPRLTAHQVQTVAKLFATEAENLAKLPNEQKKKQISAMVHKAGIFAKAKEPENDATKPGVSAPHYGSKRR